MRDPNACPWPLYELTRPNQTEIGRGMATHHGRRRVTWLVALALVVVPVLTLGIAAPADAFAPSPTNPPKLNMPSSVLEGAAPDGKSAAQLAGQIGSDAGVPAFKFGSITKVVGGVSQVVSSYSLGTTIGGVIDQQLGIDVNGTVCSGTGNDFLGQVAQTLSGADCSNYGSPQPGYVANGDAVAMPPGFPTYPNPWGTSNTNKTNYVTCGVYLAYACLGYDHTPQAITGSQTFVITDSNTVLGEGNLNGYWWCQNQSTKALTGFKSSVFLNFNTGDNNHTFTLTCAAGTVLYAVTVSSAVNTNSNPDTFPIGTTANTQGDGNKTWYSGLSPIGQQYPGTSTNPDRTLVCTITSTASAVYQGVTATFKDSDAKWPAPSCPTLPAGVTAGHMTVTMTGGPNVLTLYDQDSTAAYQAMNSAYPNCAGQSCQLDLLDGTGSCYDGDQSRCATWNSDPNKGSKYTCKYGTYTAPLAECNVLANRFDPQKVSQGDAYANPNDGTDTGQQTSVRPSTGTGASADPASGNDRNDCWPQGWAAFNPLNWVLQPIQCAFTPRKSAMNATNQRISDAVNNSAVGGFKSTLSAWSAFGVGGSGCSGVPINIDMFVIHVHDHILAACPGDTLAPQASLTKTIVTAVVISAGVLACLRYLAQIFGYSGLGSIIGRDNSDQKVNRGVRFK